LRRYTAGAGFSPAVLVPLARRGAQGDERLAL
jgi:hypothetical protein